MLAACWRKIALSSSPPFEREIRDNKLQPLLDDFRKTSDEANKTLNHVDSMLGDNRADVRQAVADLRSTLANTTGLTEQISQTLDVNSENIDEILDTLQHVMENLKEFTETIKTPPVYSRSREQSSRTQAWRQAMKNKIAHGSVVLCAESRAVARQLAPCSIYQLTVPNRTAPAANSNPFPATLLLGPISALAFVSRRCHRLFHRWRKDGDLPISSLG